MVVPSLSVVWDERFLLYDLGAGHPFSQRPRGLAAELLKATVEGGAEGVVEWVRTVHSASRARLERFHDPAYLDYVAKVSDADWPVSLDAGDTPSFPGCYEHTARIVEGAHVALAWSRSHDRPAFHPGGGFHHAHPDRASGFCIFNDVAVAVAEAVGAGLRVAYLDIDAHHGDGVMYGFYRSGRVLDIDFHQDGRTLFPGTGFPDEAGSGDGAGLKVNIPLPPLSGDEALLPLFRRIVPPLVRSYRPDVIVLQHGVDGHVGDALAHLQYTPAAYAEIAATVLALSREVSGGRLLVAGGGGYRASSVTRVLARTGVLLAGRELPGPRAPLPESWRTQYSEAIGEFAPRHWTDPEETAPSRWRPENEAKLVAELERALGTKLPAPKD